MKCPNPNCNETEHEPTAEYCHRCGESLKPKPGTGQVAAGDRLFRVKQDGSFGFVNQNGTKVIACQFSDANDFSEGLAAVKVGGKWGFIDPNFDQNKRWIVEPQFEEVRDFSEGMAAVKNHVWGYVDSNGQLVIPCQFQDAKEFSESLAAVSKGGLCGFIDKKGERVIPLQFRDAYSFKNGLARVIDNEKNRFGFINKDCKNGNYVIKPSFVYANDFSEDKSLVRNESEGYYKYISNKGKTLLICQWKYVDDFHEGLACVKAGNEYGFIDSKGNMVIEANYDDAMAFSEGLAPVKLGSSWGYINKEREMPILPMYDEAGPFHDGVAIVRKGQDYEVIDTKGNLRASNLCKTTLSVQKDFCDSESIERGIRFSKKRESAAKKIIHHLLLALLAIGVTIVEFSLFRHIHGWGWAFVPCLVNFFYTVYRIGMIEEACDGVFHGYEYVISFVSIVIFNVLAFIFGNIWMILAIPIAGVISIGIDLVIHDF